MNTDRAVWLLGGPDAGKTNYLTRFWLALRAKHGAIESAGLPADAEYLNTAAQQLAGGHFVGHTSQEVNVKNVIPIRSRLPGTSLAGSLIVPDCSGEEWLSIHKTRRWSEEWENRVQDLVGCLLFLRAGSSHIVTPLDWVGCFNLFNEAIDLGAPQQPAADVPLPTQVIAVDWLQCLRSALRDRQPSLNKLRVGVVISAWDRVPAEQLQSPPSEYISSNFGLLSQFMATNGNEFDFASFGATITGGDFDQAPEFRTTYLSGAPTDFGYVVHELGGAVAQSPDHTLPVAWALGLDVNSHQEQ